MARQLRSEAVRAPEEIISAYESASERLLRFRMMAGRRGEARETPILEAEIRLKQAEYFLKRFRGLDLEQRSLDGSVHATAGGGMSTHLHGTADVLKAHGEAFYYFSSRARDALEAIPDCDLKFDPVGVRTVRNHMLEHPDSRHGVMVSWWQYDCPEGLILAPGSTMGQGRFTDKGLYPNAQEFIEKLNAKLSTQMP
jgi:hypothetical protein